MSSSTNRFGAPILGCKRSGERAAKLAAPPTHEDRVFVDATRAAAAIEAALDVEVGEELGRGAFGVVFAATERNGARLAVKALVDPGEAAIERAVHTLVAVARIAHPSLLACDPAIVRRDGFALLRMERLDGQDIDQHLRPPKPIEGPLRPTLPLVFGQPVQEGYRSAFSALDAVAVQELRRCMWALARAVNALHGAGLVHRDIRPSNVRVTSSGRVVLIDYGAMLSPGERDAMAGAPAYIAPEQGDGATPACDWYSFGVLLFSLLTGALPFAGTAHEVTVRKHTVSAPRASMMIADVPDDLDALTARLLLRVPHLRASFDEIAATLGSQA